MAKVKRSEYIIVSRVICRLLYKANCYGKGSLYFDNLTKALSGREFKRLDVTKDKIETVLEALVKQNICGKKKKESNASELVRTRSQVTGWKYYLNMDRLDKIKEIIKESGSGSIIPILLMI